MITILNLALALVLVLTVALILVVVLIFTQAIGCGRGPVSPFCRRFPVRYWGEVRGWTGFILGVGF